MSAPSSKLSSKPSAIPKADTFQRLEIISGVARHRVWPEDTKAAIVLETLKEGACVSDVARRHKVCPSLVFKWRRKARRQSLVQPLTGFAEVQVAPVSQAPQFAPSRNSVTIEMEAAGVHLRIPSDANRDLIVTLIESLGALKRQR